MSLPKEKKLKSSKLWELVPAKKVGESSKINTKFIVLVINEPFTTNKGSTVQQFLVADETGCITMMLWDEKGKNLKEGDICTIENGFCDVHKKSLRLYVGKHGTIKRVGSFFMEYDEVNKISDNLWMKDNVSGEWILQLSKMNMKIRNVNYDKFMKK